MTPRNTPHFSRWALLLHTAPERLFGTGAGGLARAAFPRLELRQSGEEAHDREALILCVCSQLGFSLL